MRQIGTLPGTANPQAFNDYLLAQGVTSRAIESKDGWAIWVHNEDHLARAREALAAYERDPEDPRFTEARTAAQIARREAARLDRQYRKNVRDLSGSWDRINARRRPLTVFLVGVCVAVYVLERSSVEAHDWVRANLLFFPLDVLNRPNSLSHSADAIARGQVWRLITPIFMHGNLLHLLFNMWSLLVLGTVIEYRRGTQTYAILVLLSAITSNVGQLLYTTLIKESLVPWVGISGVVYALFGYLWMKGRYEPEQGIILHPKTVQIMLLWPALGFTPLLPGMANGAHLAGLIVGMLYGMARF